MMYAPEQGLFKAELFIKQLGSAWQAQLTTSSGQTLAATLGPQPNLPPPGTGAPVDYGNTLFEWVFQGELRSGLDMLKELSRGSDSEWPAMRILLKLEPDSPLTELIWETMCPSPSDLPLAASAAFSRYMHSPTPSRPVIWDRPIRILLIVANPEGLQRFDLDSVDQMLERGVLKAAEQQLHGRIIVKRLLRAQLGDIRREEKGGYHITHLLAHAVPNEGRGGVVLADPSGKATIVSLDEVAEAIASPQDTTAPYLVFLALPVNGDAPHGRVLMELSGLLVRAGVQSVVVLQAPIEPDALTTFMEVFYRVLLDTGAIDVAVAEGRKKLFRNAPNSWDWTWPVLCNRAADSALQHRLSPSMESTVSKITFGA
jgi:hypothetical protein